MDIADIVFLLGEQASGKSTIAKLVYFFKTFQEEFVNIIFTNGFEDWTACKNAYVSLLRKKFTNIFGLTKALGKFEIKYIYSAGKSVSVTPNGEYVSIGLGDLYSELASIWTSAKDVQQTIKQNALSVSMDSIAKMGILKHCQTLFNDDAYSIYIPAGRALLSRQMLLKLIRGDELRWVNQNDAYLPFDILDAPTRNYIAVVERMREGFLNKKTGDELLTFLEHTSEEILKGTYAYVKSHDYIKLKGNKLVPLSYASSGQQEVIWLLNLLYAYAALEQKCFIILEEPETHLHPDAQYLLAKYIAAFRNKTKSEVFITTHSPYVLSSFNNLFYADKCGKTVKHNVIPKHCWLKAEDFSAHILENSTTRDIKDEELAMVDIAELDAVASKQDAEYEKLLLLSKGGSLR
jgi:predicted ATP-dependent endonuclease of OLD family